MKVAKLGIMHSPSSLAEVLTGHLTAFPSAFPGNSPVKIIVCHCTLEKVPKCCYLDESIQKNTTKSLAINKQHGYYTVPPDESVIFVSHPGEFSNGYCILSELIF